LRSSSMTLASSAASITARTVSPVGVMAVVRKLGTLRFDGADAAHDFLDGRHALQRG